MEPGRQLPTSHTNLLAYCSHVPFGDPEVLAYAKPTNESATITGIVRNFTENVEHLETNLKVVELLGLPISIAEECMSRSARTYCYGHRV